MRFQSGVRFDKMTFNDYKELCKKEGLKPNEPLERFMKICLEKKTLNIWSNFEGDFEDQETITVKTIHLLYKIECEIEGITKNLKDEDYSLYPETFDYLIAS